MTLAALEPASLLMMGGLLLLVTVLFAGMRAGGCAVRGRHRVASPRLVNVEHKLDQALQHLGVAFTPAPKEDWQLVLDENPRLKLEAVKVYTMRHGVGLMEAKQAVEDYMEGTTGRLVNVDHKLDLVLKHLGVEFVPAPKAEWQIIVDNNPGLKLDAVKAYKEQHGVSLMDAKKAVEDYMAGIV